jgi:short-subunit dehydrogenase
MEIGMSRTPPRRYWLTGAGSGIGAALAEALLQTGAHLALSSRTVAPLSDLSQRFPGQVWELEGDLTNSQTVREIGERIAAQWGSLDTLILNAGTCEYVEARQVDTSIIEHVVRTNLLASSFCIEAALPLLRAGTTPHLVGMASSVTYLPLPRAEASGSSKAGLHYLFNSLRTDVAAQGIDITVINPGFIETAPSSNDGFTLPLSWSLEKAAQYILDKVAERPLEITFPAAFMATLWPLSTSPAELKVEIGKRIG